MLHVHCPNITLFYHKKFDKNQEIATANNLLAAKFPVIGDFVFL